MEGLAHLSIRGDAATAVLTPFDMALHSAGLVCRKLPIEPGD
jgi:hypothetical protein